LTYAGNSSSTGGTDGYTTLIGYNVKVAGTAQVNADFSSLGGSSPIENVLFTE
jgi:hypothetical protein